MVRTLDGILRVSFDLDSRDHLAGPCGVVEVSKFRKAGPMKILLLANFPKGQMLLHVKSWGL